MKIVTLKEALGCWAVDVSVVSGCVGACWRWLLHEHWAVQLSHCPGVMVLSRWYLLNCVTFCNQTWHAGALSCAGVSCVKKDWFSIFKVKITVMAYIIQTWHACVLLYARVLCVKIGWFDVLKVKITVMAYIIKIRLFLLYLLNKNVSIFWTNDCNRR